MNRNFRFNVSLERFAFLTEEACHLSSVIFKRPLEQSPGTGLKRNGLTKLIFKSVNKIENPAMYTWK